MGVGNRGDCFVFDSFKNRISQLGKEISKKDEIISFLTEQISVKNALTIPLQNQGPERRSANNNSLNDSIESEVTREEAHTTKLNKEKKVVVAGDSLLNGISEKGLSRDHQVTVKNLPGGTTEKVLEEIEDLVADKPDCIIIHAGTNDITNSINSLNSVKKIVKDVKKSSPNTRLVFSSILIRKDKKGISKKVTDINTRLKNYCQQKHLDFIDNSNILVEHLGNRKLQLNKRGNSVLANNFIKYLQSSFSTLDDFSCVRDFQTEYGSQQLLSFEINGFTNKAYEKNLRLIRQENLNRIILAHLNINSIRNKFDLLANQITANVNVLVI